MLTRPRYMMWKTSVTGDEDGGKTIRKHNYCSNTSGIIRHVMVIAAAMEVWEPSTASSSGEIALAMDRPLSNPTGESTSTEVNGLLEEEGLPHNSTNAAHAGLPADGGEETSEQCGAERERRSNGEE